MSNPIQWLEIPVSDLDRAKAFYTTVFGIQGEFIEMPTSKMFMFGEPGVDGSAGALVQGEGMNPSSDGSIPYFSCEDLTNELGKVEGAGGKIVLPKTDNCEFGNYAQILDSEGNRIGLHSDQ